MKDEVNNIAQAVSDLVAYRGTLIADFVEKLEAVDAQLQTAREAFAKLSNLPSVRDILRPEGTKKRRADYGVKRGPRGGNGPTLHAAETDGPDAA
jgi:hypothetical protein